MTPIAILGAGMAGFGAVHRFHGAGVSSVLFEEKTYHGGHTASFSFKEGFIFDDGPHVSFTKSERIQRLFAESVDHEYEVIRARVNNYWRGYWIKHPAQCNLYGLPTDLTVAALQDFIHAQHQDHGELENYADWLVASYGKTFASTFPMEYGLKYHTTRAEHMTTDWLGPRLYRPALTEVLRGALAPQTTDVHYISEFRYPSHNGFVSYLKPFLRQTDLRLGHRVIRIDPRSRELQFANGAVASYDHVVSSIPLPVLVSMIVGAPSDVEDASRRLACSTCVVVNVGINRTDISEAHWTYFYDRDFFFTRLSFPHMLSRHTVPPGSGSIQAEVYYSPKYRPLDRTPEACIEPVIADLRRCGLIRDDDEILFSNARLVPFANVIFDFDRAGALATIHAYLDEIGIAYCGRYGDWGYMWTDESFMSGENAAQRILDRM
jgi:protoporphyrinogen oxidase